MSFRRQIIIIHTSTLVTVFTIKVGEYNFIVLTYLLTLGGAAPRGRHLEEHCTRSEYFTTSNCVLNFNFLAPVVSEIIWGSQICIKGPCAPQTPYSGKILTQPIQYRIKGVLRVLQHLGPGPQEGPRTRRQGGSADHTPCTLNDFGYAFRQRQPISVACVPFSPVWV